MKLPAASSSTGQESKSLPIFLIQLETATIFYPPVFAFINTSGFKKYQISFYYLYEVVFQSKEDQKIKDAQNKVVDIIDPAMVTMTWDGVRKTVPRKQFVMVAFSKVCFSEARISLTSV